MALSESSPLEGRIRFLPARAEDFENLVILRIAAMRESLERIGRFDPARARERLRDSFWPEHTFHIVLDEHAIGFYTFRPVECTLELVHFYIHPAFQNQGIGSFVLSNLITQAERRRMPIRLGALRESVSNAFYLRHGFVKTSEDEWDIHYVRKNTNALGRRGDEK